MYFSPHFSADSRQVEESAGSRTESFSLGEQRASFSLGEAYLALQKYENESKVIAQRLSASLYSGEGSL